MSQTLEQIAEQLHDANKKVQLIYAFNGTGKTRLSGEFKELISPKDGDGDAREKILYYNAFTEDLFIWDNDLAGDASRILKIQPNSFTEWILKDQGQDQNIVANFQHYADKKLTPRFDTTFSEVTFTFDRGDDQSHENCKISKGEESLFIWSVFYTLLQQVLSILGVPEPEDRETNQFDQLEYVFIDDPVSSLDENHLIELAVNLAVLIKSAPSELKFILTTHNPLFYNVLHNEFQLKDSSSAYRPKHARKYRLNKNEDGSFALEPQPNDRPFSYHLFLMEELQNAIENNQIKKYHFNFLRNVLEKTATFLGYKNWGDLLPKSDPVGTNLYLARIINLYSHSAHAGEEVAEPSENDKRVLGFLVRRVSKKYYSPDGRKTK